ncbi:UBE2J1, partial [Symbiodinium microadriaticum]
MALNMDRQGRNGGGFGSTGSTSATSSIKRIQRELKEISESPSRHWIAGPAKDDLFEWLFAVRGPPSTDFEGGIYTGKIVLPVNYPLAPPSITMLTPSGRWEVGKKICLSNTNYHAELWQPAWGIRTIMEALRSHFPVAGDGAVGALDWPSHLRQRLAKESLDFITLPGSAGQWAQKNRELLPELSPEELKEAPASGNLPLYGSSYESQKCLRESRRCLSVVPEPYMRNLCLCMLAQLVVGSNQTFPQSDSQVRSGRVDCARECRKENEDQPCLWDDQCPGLGCSALGFANCRYCGFGEYAPCPLHHGASRPRPPPISSCSPLGTYTCSRTCFNVDAGAETNVITMQHGTPYFENRIRAGNGFEETQQCSQVQGIGGTNMYSCVTNWRREHTLKIARFLQQITFNADCTFFVKKVWRMSPQPVSTCTVRTETNTLTFPWLRAGAQWELPERPSEVERIDTADPAPQTEISTTTSNTQAPLSGSSPEAPGAVPSPPPAPAAGAPAAAPRRRREGERPRRSQQSLVVQLLKPPTTGRGWLLMSLNFLIVLMLVSFCIVLADVI